MENNLLFEQNLDVILKHLEDKEDGVLIDSLNSLNIVGNKHILIDYLSKVGYVAQRQEVKIIYISKLGEKFIAQNGGFVQEVINKQKLEEHKTKTINLKINRKWAFIFPSLMILLLLVILTM